MRNNLLNSSNRRSDEERIEDKKEDGLSLL